MSAWRTLDGRPPRVIAHRGASGYLPEHTLAGYALAAQQGADVLEPDLLPSRDRVLYARHDYGLARSTDVATRPAFASRVRELDGMRDWWITDFDAIELDTLRAIQPFAQRDHVHDGLHAPPRFAAVLDLAARLSAEQGRVLPVYPELKHPERCRARGLDPVALLAAELQPRGLAGPQAPVWLQCFDHGVLREAGDRLGNPCYALVETLPAEPDARDAALRELATWARGIAPDKRLLWDGRGRDSGLVDAAHAAGLEVHAWTFRDDLGYAPFADVRAELHMAFALGVDALFCDFPDTAVAARATFARG